MKHYMILLGLFTIVLFAQQGKKSCVLIKTEGRVQIREPYEQSWNSAEEGFILEDHTTIRSGEMGSAAVRDYEGKLFHLPPNSQIETKELKKMSRDEIIMDLTVLEMQKLPDHQKNYRQKDAYILHGSVDDLSDTTGTQKYLLLEENGAMGLFRQGYLGGFILKWNRLKNSFPEVSVPKVEMALIEAYNKMNMPVRRNEIMKTVQYESN